MRIGFILTGSVILTAGLVLALMFYDDISPLIGSWSPERYILAIFLVICGAGASLVGFIMLVYGIFTSRKKLD